MATTKRLIEGALRKIGVLAAGEEAEPSELADALETANEWLESLSNEGLLVYALTHESFDLVGQASYTIGVGGDFDTTRPITIEDMRVRDSGGLEEPVKIVSLNIWSGISIKNTTVTFPDYAYYEPEYPLGVIKFDSIPETGNTLKIVSKKQLSALPALTSEVDLPPGYSRFIRLGLAIELAPEFGKAIDNATAGTYRQATAALKRTNSASRVPTLKVDAGLTMPQEYDINAGPQ